MEKARDHLFIQNIFGKIGFKLPAIDIVGCGKFFILSQIELQ